MVFGLIQSGAWDFRDYIVPGAVAIPLVIEGVLLAKQSFENPERIQEACCAFKNRLVEAFSPQVTESTGAAALRIVRNSALLLACIGLMALALYAAFFVLPASMALSFAMSSTYLIGKLFWKGEEYINDLIATFTAQPDEDLKEVSCRIAAAIVKTVIGGLIALGVLIIGAYVLTPLFTNGFSWSVNLPFQTKGVVLAEYLIVGLLHALLSIRHFRKGEHALGVFHVVAALLSVLFPISYWGEGMRLHHSFYGLLMMALPSRPMRILGSLITFDSALFFSGISRGHMATNDLGLSYFTRYDFINSIVDNFFLFLTGYSAALILEDVNSAYKRHS